MKAQVLRLRLSGRGSPGRKAGHGCREHPSPWSRRPGRMSLSRGSYPAGEGKLLMRRLILLEARRSFFLVMEICCTYRGDKTYGLWYHVSKAVDWNEVSYCLMILILWGKEENDFFFFLISSLFYSWALSALFFLIIFIEEIGHFPGEMPFHEGWSSERISSLVWNKHQNAFFSPYRIYIIADMIIDPIEFSLKISATSFIIHASLTCSQFRPPAHAL